MAAKTPFGVLHVRNLAKLNDLFCHVNFLYKHFELDLERFSNAVNENFVKDVYSNNSKAKSINIRLKDLPEHTKKLSTFSFGSFSSNAYEYYHEYSKELLEFIGEVSGTRLEKFKGEDDESFLNRTLLSIGCIGFPQEIFDTLRYLRLRRNMFIHLIPSPSEKMRGIMDTKGVIINSYWTGIVKQIDFTDKASLHNYGELTCIDSLMICRIIIQRLDTVVVDTIGFDKIFSFEYAKRYKKPITDYSSSEQIIRTERIKKAMNIMYGI